MVLHHAHKHFVALFKERLAKGESHEVEAFGSAAREDYFRLAAGIDKILHIGTRLLVELRGLLRKIMHAPMHVGVHRIIFFGHRLHHGAGLLRGGRVVEIDQRAVVDRAGEYGKILAYFFDVEHCGLLVIGFAQRARAALLQAAAEAHFHQIGKALAQRFRLNAC